MPKKVVSENEIPEVVPTETAEVITEPEVQDENTEIIPESEAAAENESVPKPKRTRKKKPDTENTEPSEDTAPPVEEEKENTPESESQASLPIFKGRNVKPKTDTILTLEVGADVETEENASDIAWHEIHNAYRTRRILTGLLGGIEQTDAGKTIAIVEYKGFRIVIPLKEMTVKLPNQLSGDDYAQMVTRQNKLISKMLGAEIDFVVKGIDSKTRTVVASRKEAMLKKRQLFYMETDNTGAYRIYDGRIIQARIVAVAEKAIRIEAFGVETSIMARDLAWDWIGDAHDRFSVGDQILVRVLDVKRDNIEDISIRADAKSVSDNTSQDNLRKCRVQSKYAGKVTDVHKGVVYVRLTNGVNAIAHSCYDRRMPGKKDDVSFAVTRIDQDRGVAVGIITRIIKQNL
ncbi:MAG: S1 RNA-binding domain-containing protein [Clostridiales bacterium]|nr:S1 RNA-binding domain-containing protein [Clostridiales bacterium]